MDDAETTDTRTARAATDLGSPVASVRLRAALTAGTHPDPGLVDLLLDRCAVEPDFFVRDTLTWALVQAPREVTVPALRTALESPTTQARSQALHTLSKLVVPQAWAWVFPALLCDPDDEVARAAWRVAVGIVPRGREGDLAETLLAHLGRGDAEVKKSLSRALVDLALLSDGVVDLLTQARDGLSAPLAAHAEATLTLLRDPGAGFEGAYGDALRRRGLR